MLIFLHCALPAHAQNENPTFGIVIKPVIPSSLFTNTSFTSTQSDVTYNITPKPSLSFGAALRLGLFGQFSFESGINYTQRSYELLINSPRSDISSSFKIVDYEIPFLGMVYIKIAERAYVNTSFGLSFDFFPNDIAKQKDSLLLIGKRVYWVEPALVAKAGFEYHTEKNGFFYIGGTYHRMLGNMYALRMDYKESIDVAHFQRFLPGSYFAFELKWFFPNTRSDPEG